MYINLTVRVDFFALKSGYLQSLFYFFFHDPHCNLVLLFNVLFWLSAFATKVRCMGVIKICCLPSCQQPTLPGSLNGCIAFRGDQFYFSIPYLTKDVLIKHSTPVFNNSVLCIVDFESSWFPSDSHWRITVTNHHMRKLFYVRKILFQNLILPTKQKIIILINVFWKSYTLNFSQQYI